MKKPLSPDRPRPDRGSPVPSPRKTGLSRSWILLLALLLAGPGAPALFGAEPSASSARDGFQSLFNGRDLAGWYTISKGKTNNDPDHLFQVHDGMVHMYKDATNGSKQPFGYICTEKEYADYHLRFQYKWGEKKFIPKVNAKRDCGLLYHVVGPDGVWPQSVECQIQEGDTGDIFAVSTRVSTTIDPSTVPPADSTNATQVAFKPASAGGVPFVQGVAKGVRRVRRSENHEVEGWNTVEVIARGGSSVHIINGKTNNAVLKLERFVNNEWVPLTQGRLLLQQEGAEVFYRNIEIKLLK
jgi:hypothetical protein